MTAILKSLQTITTGYTSFEKDQVLTHEQLNTVSDYADDQIRLTRVKLIGVGLVEGLRVSQVGAELRLSPGVGITTDGDLARLEQELRYDRFEPFDRPEPTYAPFERSVGGATERIPVFELVPLRAEHPRASALADFPGGLAALQGMTAVLYIESCVLDADLCTGTSCDNMGQQVTHSQKLLLVEREAAAGLGVGIRVPHEAYFGLRELSLARMVPHAQWTQKASYHEAFRALTRTAHNDLMQALDELEQQGLPVPDTFATSPIDEWRQLLARHQREREDKLLGIQYYHDFLRDLAETWNAAREELFDDCEWLHTDIEPFPKHLLLGDLENPEHGRTRFYPSPALRRNGDSRAHHRALMRKFDRLIRSFDPAFALERPVRITPSALVDRPLEERAIPAYYAPDVALARAWSHHHHLRASHDRVLGYHASHYSNLPQVVEPLGAPLGGHSFFRIEGHVARPVEAAKRELEAQIRSWSLPIAVEALSLDAPGRPIVVRPPSRYTDLHRLHAVIRQDLVQQLGEVTTFSQSLKSDLRAAIESRRIDDSDAGSGVSLTQLSEQEHALLIEKAESVKQKVGTDYASYRAAPTWKEDLREALQSSARLKQDPGPVSRTQFATPADTLISSTHHSWLEAIDGLVDAREEAAQETLRFGTFLGAHPGAEHQAGVTPGGTFLLVYDEAGTVIGDLMLPYLCCEPEAEADEPVKTAPTIRPEWLKKNGLKLSATVDKTISQRLDLFEARLKPELIERIQVQGDYFKLFQGLATGTRAPLDATSPGVRYLDLVAQDADNKRAMLELLRAEQARGGAAAPSNEVVSAAELALASSIEAVVSHIAATDTPVVVGSDGFRRLEEVSSHLDLLSEARRLETGDAIARIDTNDAALGRVLRTFGRS